MKEEKAVPVDGRAVRWVAVEVAPGLEVAVLEAADPDAQIEAALAGGGDPYAGILWPTAIVLARALAEAVPAGLRVLELGAGTGLCALTAARLGARATALDHDPFALRLIDAAADRQRLAVETRRFDLASSEPLPPADVVVLADLLYEPALARLAAARVIEAVRRGARALVGDPGRAGRAAFVRELAGAGLAARFRDVPARLPGDPLRATVGVAWVPGEAADPEA